MPSYAKTVPNHDKLQITSVPESTFQQYKLLVFKREGLLYPQNAMVQHQLQMNFEHTEMNPPSCQNADLICRGHLNDSLKLMLMLTNMLVKNIKINGTCLHRV